jgi:hypothetical protein
MIWPLPADDLTVPQQVAGLSWHQGGVDGLHPGGRGARDEGAGGDRAGVERAAELVAGGRRPGGQPPGRCGGCDGATSSTGTTGCSITGGGRRRAPSRWPRSSASCGCTASAMGRAMATPASNIRHFYQVACRDHGVQLSYTVVKQALQAAGLVGKRRPRGRHRRREPRPCFGKWVGPWPGSASSIS